MHLMTQISKLLQFFKITSQPQPYYFPSLLLDIPNRFYIHIVQYSVVYVVYEVPITMLINIMETTLMAGGEHESACQFLSISVSKQFLKNSHKTLASLSGQYLMLLFRQGWREIYVFLILTLFFRMHIFFFFF